MLQMAILQPKLAILDEIDSGLDIDALKDVAEAIRSVRQQDPKRSMLVVTHFERFLRYVEADHVPPGNDIKELCVSGKGLFKCSALAVDVERLKEIGFRSICFLYVAW